MCLLANVISVSVIVVTRVLRLIAFEVFRSAGMMLF